MQLSSGHLSQSTLSLLDRSKIVYLKGFNRGSEGLSWYEYLLLLSVSFKNSRKEVFQIEVQLLSPEAPPCPELLSSKQSVTLASKKGVEGEGELATWHPSWQLRELIGELF